MPRTDLYRNVHMGQGARPFTLAVELGAADMSRRGAADGLPDARHALYLALSEVVSATLAVVSTTLGPDRRDRLHDDLGVPEVWALRRAGTA